MSYFIKFLKAALMILGVGFIVTPCWDFIQSRQNTSPQSRFLLTPVSRGDLEEVVTCSGTLKAIGTVEVGTQVSGTIEKLYVNFNDRVQKGEIMAALDSALFEASVTEAQANVIKAEASLEQAKANYVSNKRLFDRRHLSELEFLPFKTTLETARATLLSAQAGLQRANTNLKHAVIQSPITGTVIERSIEAGQTVAASLSAPTLFIIAEDLSQMQIEADVDESDIGQIKQDQKVRFTVQAWPDQTFYGTVRQIRLNPVTIQNVVNYKVIITTLNSENLLMPGMTATVDFIVNTRENVLRVANTALSFQPDSELRKEILSQRDRPATFSGKRMRQQPEKKIHRLIVLDTVGELRSVQIDIGLSDGQLTEIIVPESSIIQEDSQVVRGIKRTDSATRAKSGLFSRSTDDKRAMRRVR